MKKLQAAFVAALVSTGFVQAQQVYNAIPIPDTMRGPVFNLEIKEGTMDFLPPPPPPLPTPPKTQTAGYNPVSTDKTFLGPTLIMYNGEAVQMHVTNRLTEETTTHWHGIHLPAVMDGGPHQVIGPNKTWSPYWEVKNHAATYWYHPHLHHETQRHVNMGIAGLIIVRDAEEAALALPRTYGVDDVPLVVTERAFDAERQIRNEQYGDTVIVNGALHPKFDAPAQVVRFRILCAAPGRSYNLGFSDNRTFYAIASDGGLLEAPVPLTRFVISPGERIEILVNFSGQQGQNASLMAYNFDLPKDVPGGEPPALQMNRLTKRNFEIIRFDVVAPTANPITAIPASLVSVQRYSESASQMTRTLLMTDTILLPDPTPIPIINRQFFDHDRTDFNIQLEATEVWELINHTLISHPFHLHDVEFFVLDRNGVPPAPEEAGWKDVVNVYVDETVRIIAKFTNYADPDNHYMFHCHILSHEDHGMMGQFIVTDTSGVHRATAQTATGWVKLFPNPAQASFRFLCEKHLRLKDVAVVNSVGQRAKHVGDYQSGDDVDVSELAPGLYFVTAFDAVSGEPIRLKFQKR